MHNKQKFYLFVLGAIITSGSLLYSFRNTDISLNDKIFLTIILSEKPIVHHYRTSLKFYDDIELNARGFRKSFFIENFEYKASAYTTIEDRFKEGDTLTIWIDKGEIYNKRQIVYGLRHRNVDYINIIERNKIKSRYNKYGLIVALYGLFLIYNLYLKNGLRLTYIKAVMILLLILIGIYRITK